MGEICNIVMLTIMDSLKSLPPLRKNVRSISPFVPEKSIHLTLFAILTKCLITINESHRSN